MISWVVGDLEIIWMSADRICTGRSACGKVFQCLGAVPDGPRAVRKLPEFAELQAVGRLPASTVSPARMAP